MKQHLSKLLGTLGDHSHNLALLVLILIAMSVGVSADPRGPVLSDHARTGHGENTINGNGPTSSTGSGTQADPFVNDWTVPEGMALQSVADIDDPRTELNARTGDAAGSLLLVYETDYSGSIDGCTIYRTDNSNLTEATPWIVDSGDSKSYVTVSGRYALPSTFVDNLQVTNGSSRSIALSTLFSTAVVYTDLVTGFTHGQGYPSISGSSKVASWPNATGTVLLDTTPYADFQDFSNRFLLFGSNDTDGAAGEVDLDGSLTMTGSTLGVAPGSLSSGYFANDSITTAQLADLAAASRIHGSGSGGAAAIELVAERGLDIDANGIGISTDGVTTAMIADRGAASRIIGSGSGGAGTIDLTAEDGLDIDADGIGITAGGVTAAMLDDDQNPIYKLVAVSSANHTCDGTERFVSMTTGGSNRTVNLDDPVAGQVLTVMKADAAGGTVTLDGAGGDTINGATTVVLAATQFKYGTIVAISTSAWIVIASN